MQPRFQIFSFDDSSVWARIRPSLTEDVYGKNQPLLMPGIKMTLTKIPPGGEFSEHSDSHHHLFFILSGEAQFTIASQSYDVLVNSFVEILAGTSHSYKNVGKNDLVMLTFNSTIQK